MKKTIEEQLSETVAVLGKATRGETSVHASYDVSNSPMTGHSVCFIVGWGSYASDSKWPFKTIAHAELESVTATALAYIHDRDDINKIAIDKISDEAARLGYALIKKEGV
jgi:hypothetical protein